MILCSRNKKAFQIKKENKTIKNRKIRDIRNLLDMKKMIITNQYEQLIFGVIIILNIKIMMIQVKLDHT